jgi:hypothetical protein
MGLIAPAWIDSSFTGHTTTITGVLAVLDVAQDLRQQPAPRAHARVERARALAWRESSRDLAADAAMKNDLHFQPPTGPTRPPADRPRRLSTRLPTLRGGWCRIPVPSARVCEHLARV